MAVQSCWTMAGTETLCRTHWYQTCSVVDMSGDYARHGRTGTFSASRNCVLILVKWNCALSCWNMRWWRRMNGTTMGLRSLSCSLCIQIAIDKMQLCSLSVGYVFPYHNPTMEHSVHNVNSKPVTHTMPYVCNLPGIVETGINRGRAHFSSVPVAIEGELWWTFLQSACQTACSLKTWDICGIVLCNKLQILMGFCPQHKVHLCNDHAV